MKNKGPLQRFIDKAFFLGLFLSALGFVGFVVLLMQKVQSGEGLESYFTGFGVKVSYLGIGILISVIPAITLVALVVRWWQGREERNFLEKYKQNKNEKNT